MKMSIRGRTVHINKNLFVTIAFAKDIDYQPAKKGKPRKARNEDEKIKVIDILVAALRPSDVAARKAEVLAYLNSVGQYLTPITNLVVDGV